MPKGIFSVNKDSLQVTFEREFDASRQKLWDAMIDADAIAQWWGPRKYVTTIEKNDARAGGEWRYVQKDADGNEFGFHGIYVEVVPPEKCVQTFNFEGIPPGHELVQTLTLTDVGPGKTKLFVVAQYATIEDLDGMVNSNMEWGMREGFDRLEELLTK